MDNRNYYDRRQTAARTPKRHKKNNSGNKLAALFDILRPGQGNPDYVFVGVVVVLLAYGIIMLYSAGSARAYANYGDSFYFMKSQLFGVALGLVGMIVASRLDYHWFSGRIAGMLYLGCAVLLLLVLCVGTTVNGAKRWIFGFQPSEVAKFALILIFATNLAKESAQRTIKSFKTGFLPYLIMLGLYVVLIYFQPHLSCIILIGLTAMLLLFVAGAPMKYFICIVLAAIAGVGVAIAQEPYRIARITAFVDPFADAQKSGWQIVQSLYAIGSGGIFGVGLGQSRQKFLSLPEPHNDFIFSVLCEELGLIGAIFLMVLFVILIGRGIRIAMKAPDLFGTLLVMGIVGIVAFQALINIAVVTSTVPNTGMPLPFFSYGSTALCITMAEMGVVMNVSRQIRNT